MLSAGAALYVVGPDGALTDVAEEPIAADARPQGDGKDAAKLKVVAGLLGVGLDEVVRRAERARRHTSAQLGRRARHADGDVCRSGGLGGDQPARSGRAAQARRADARRRDRNLQHADLRPRGALPRAERRAGRTREGHPRTRAQAAGAAHRIGTDVPPALRRSEAAALHEITNTLLAIGDTADAYQAIDRSRAIVEDLLKTNPNDTGWQRDLALCYLGLGEVLRATGKREDALAAYRKALAISQKLVELHPANRVWQHDLAIAHDDVGDMAVRAGQREDALASYRDALAIRQKLVDGNNADDSRAARPGREAGSRSAT